MVNQPGDARRRTQARRADRGLLCADGFRLASNCATKGGRERDTGARITRPSKGNVARQTTSPRRLRFDTSSTRAQRAAYNRIRLDRQPPATPAATTRAQNSRICADPAVTAPSTRLRALVVGMEKSGLASIQLLLRQGAVVRATDLKPFSQ